MQPAENVTGLTIWDRPDNIWAVPALRLFLHAGILGDASFCCP